MGRSVWSGLIDMCNALRGGVTRDNMQCKDILIWQPQASKMIDVRHQIFNPQSLHSRRSPPGWSTPPAESDPSHKQTTFPCGPQTRHSHMQARPKTERATPTGAGGGDLTEVYPRRRG